MIEGETRDANLISRIQVGKTQYNIAFVWLLRADQSLPLRQSHTSNSILELLTFTIFSTNPPDGQNSQE